MVAAPLVCPEQQVRIVDEDFSSEIGNVDYRSLPGGEVKQMVISIPRLAAGAKAHATVTFEVTTRPILPPEQTDDLKIPEHPPKGVRQFLGGSPFIETKSPKIAKLGKGSAGRFRRIDHRLAKGRGDLRLRARSTSTTSKARTRAPRCACTTSRPIARAAACCSSRLCRVNKIPARMVWVDNHAYPEFYLEDADKHGYWFPAESAGTRAFGEMPLARTILQKGDNFVVPERPKDHLRYASDFGVGLPVGNGGGKPKHNFVREQVPLSR